MCAGTSNTHPDPDEGGNVVPAPISVRREPASRRLKALTAVAAVCALVAWYVVLTDPYYRDRLLVALSSRTARAAPDLPDPATYEVHDPALGSPFPQMALGREIRRKLRPSSHGYLVAAMGDCSSCTSLSVPKLYSQTRKRGITLLAVVGGEAARIRDYVAYLHREGLDVPVFRDSDGKLLAGLNAYYAGRLYYYTPGWRLRWRERDAHIDNYLFTTGRFSRIMENAKP